MHVITRKRLNEFSQRHPEARTSLAHWYRIVRRSRFANFARLREVFPHANQVGRLTVFNVGGNKVRLVAALHYNRNKVYIRHVLTMRNTTRANGRNDMSATELAKVTKAWPPISREVRVPRTKGEYEGLVEFLDGLTDEVGEDENHPLASLMDVVAVLIEKYEDEHVPHLTAASKAFAYGTPKNSGKSVSREKSTAYRKSSQSKKASKIFS
jgi:mRNA interferase HigB